MTERWESVDILIDSGPPPRGAGPEPSGPSAANPLFPDRRKARRLTSGPWLTERTDRGVYPWRVVSNDGDRVVAVCRTTGDAEAISFLPLLLLGLERVHRSTFGQTKRDIAQLLDLIGWSEEYTV